MVVPSAGAGAGLTSGGIENSWKKIGSAASNGVSDTLFYSLHLHSTLFFVAPFGRLEGILLISLFLLFRSINVVFLSLHHRRRSVLLEGCFEAC